MGKEWFYVSEIFLVVFYSNNTILSYWGNKWYITTASTTKDLWIYDSNGYYLDYKPLAVSVVSKLWVTLLKMILLPGLAFSWVNNYVYLVNGVDKSIYYYDR